MPDVKHGEFWWIKVKRPGADLYSVGLVQNIGDDLAVQIIGKETVYYLDFEDDPEIEFIRRIPVPRILTSTKEPRK